MKVSNWLKSGRRSKKMDEAIINIDCQNSGPTWDEYVMITIYSKEKQRFLRLQMTVDEAKRVQSRLNSGMEKFQNTQS